MGHRKVTYDPVTHRNSCDRPWRIVCDNH